MNKPSYLQVFRNAANSLLVLLFLGYALHWFAVPLLQRLDNVAYDWRLRVTMPKQLDERIVILDIDEKSLAELGRWPWPRPILAKLVDTLFLQYQVKLLAFDVIFSEADNTSPLALLSGLAGSALRDDAEFQNLLQRLRPQLAYDEIFAASLQNRPVILSFFTSDLANASPLQALPAAWAEAMAITAELPAAAGYGGNLALLQTAAAGAGYFNNPRVDEDGVFRRIPLLSRYQGQIYPALSLAIYRQLLGKPALEFAAADGRLEGLMLQQQLIPTAADSSVLTPYRGKQHSFAYYSVSDILHQTIDKTALAGKIVLVGSTAAGLMDLRSTPVQNVFPGVEIHANLVSAMLDHSLKSKPYYLMAWESVQILLIGLLSCLWFTDQAALINSLRFFGLSLVIMLGNTYLWTAQNLDCLPASPLLLLSLLFFNQLICAYISQSQRINTISRLFGLYISPQLVNQLVQAGQQVNMAGETRELTVLFVDVRGFTGIAETMPAPQLCALMNEILSPFTQIILQHQGTVDKYIGDAIMAFWGAPLDDQRHASHAIAAALDMTAQLPELNRRFAERHWPPIEVGIGINSGAMSVGNMGSDFRMAYTVMGDNVNIAARLEGLCKIYGVAIIVSDACRQLAPEFIYRELDQVQVKGKHTALSLYQPLAKMTQLDTQMLTELNLLDSGLKYYRHMQWQAAAAIFQQLANQAPQDGLYQLYQQRIAAYQQHPPAPGWTGIFIQEQK